MKSNVSSLLIAFAVYPFSISAQGLETGYRGSIEIGYSKEILGATMGFDWKEINTVHGYQATPNIFLGAGVGVHFTPKIPYKSPFGARENSTEIPVFADIQWTMLKKNITPLVDLRVGHCISDGSGMYTSIGGGCRMAIKSNTGVYVMFSYSTHNKVDYNSMEDSNSGLSARLGFEF